MNLADAFRTLDHEDLNIIYDNLPFVRTLSQDPIGHQTHLRDRHAALAEALLLARDSFITSHQEASGPSRRLRQNVHSPAQYDPSHDSEEDSSEDDSEELVEDEDSTRTYGREPLLPKPIVIPQIQARTSSTKYGPYGGQQKVRPVRPHIFSPNTPDSRTADLPLQPPPNIRAQHQVLAKTAIFIVPPTVNPYDPIKDYLPMWLKRTYMYWRWTLKLPTHDIPQRYAVWIALHLSDSSIRYHIQTLSTEADEGHFSTSIEVNDYILKKAAGHIKVQEDLARIEFNRLLQRENTSVISFNSTFLRVFNKVRHFYDQDRLAIQYYDRIVPRIRKRLNVSFYERYTSNDGSMRSRSFPTLEGLMLAAEQVDDYYRPLPPVPRKPTFFEAMSAPLTKKNARKSGQKTPTPKPEKSREKLKTS